MIKEHAPSGQAKKYHLSGKGIIPQKLYELIIEISLIFYMPLF